jgi:hypothetical protein
VTLEADEFYIFVEGSRNVSDVIEIIGDSISLQELNWGGGRAYSIEGYGAFIVRGDHECLYTPGALQCEGQTVDVTMGGVIFKRDGEILATNPLPIMAR